MSSSVQKAKGLDVGRLAPKALQPSFRISDLRSLLSVAMVPTKAFSPDSRSKAAKGCFFKALQQYSEHLKGASIRYLYCSGMTPLVCCRPVAGFVPPWSRRAFCTSLLVFRYLSSAMETSFDTTGWPQRSITCLKVYFGFTQITFSMVLTKAFTSSNSKPVSTNTATTSG